MALNTQRSYAACNASAAAVGAMLNNGYLRIYSGTQPANADAPATGTLLAELRFNATAFGSPTNGIIEANAITPEDSALASGTAGWFRCLSSDGTTVVFDGSIGLSNSNYNMLDVDIVEGAPVVVNNMAYVAPR